MKSRLPGASFFNFIFGHDNVCLRVRTCANMEERELKCGGLVGRKKIISSRKKMQTVIDDYFESLKALPVTDENGDVITDKHGNPMFYPEKPPTTAGLCRALGFNSRQTLLNYRHDGQFADIVDDAMLRIEEYTETRLFDRDGANGAKFSLANNFKWNSEKKIKFEDETPCGEMGVVLLAPVAEE